MGEECKPVLVEQGNKPARLRIFENCHNLIRTLPMLQYDEKNPNDCAKEPHELTHAPDAIRYFVAGRPLSTEIALVQDEEEPDYDMQLDSFLGGGWQR